MVAGDFGSDESSENEGILDVFPVFRTARMGQKTRYPAADDLFRVSLNSYDTNCAVLDGNVLTIMQDNTISQVSVKDGALLLHKEFECWGCTFGLYHVSKGYVVYGEEEILMLDEDFHKLWGFTSRDIFVSCTRGEAFEVDERSIRVYNWFDDYYELDFSGKVIREILQETDL